MLLLLQGSNGTLVAWGTIGNLNKNDRLRLRDISNETSDAFRNMSEYFKDENHPGLLRIGEISCIAFAIQIATLRMHPVFDAWRAKRELQIKYLEERDPKGDELIYKKTLEKYESKINEYIKPEVISNGTFDKYMKIFCAGNKVLYNGDYIDPDLTRKLNGGHYKIPLDELSGEFKNTKIRRTANQSWYTLDSWSDWMGLKEKKNSNEIEEAAGSIACMLKDPSKFDEIKKLFYGSYRALTYAQKLDIKEIENQKIEEYTGCKFEALIKSEIKDINLFAEFALKFKEYRYSKLS